MTQSKFTGAQLQRASFFAARLEGVNFICSDLRGARLEGAHLQGAYLRCSQLEATTFDAAELQGASLSGTQLQGASLVGTRLEGATLENAHLEAARLNNANLSGATFDGAQLQGVSFDNAKLNSASFKHAFVWRSDARRAIWGDNIVRAPETGPSVACDQNGKACPWSAEVFTRVKELVAEYGTSEMMKTIDQTLDPAKPFLEQETAKIWIEHAALSVPQSVYESRLAERWRELGCATEGAPYVASALIGRLALIVNSPFDLQSSEISTLTTAFLAADCLGTRELSLADRAELKKIIHEQESLIELIGQQWHRQ